MGESASVDRSAASAESASADSMAATADRTEGWKGDRTAVAAVQPVDRTAASAAG